KVFDCWCAIKLFIVYVCTPSINNKQLDSTPAIKYFLKPNTAQIAIATGADNWNSLPGMPVGILKEPLITINAASKLTSTSVYTFLFTNLSPSFSNYEYSIDLSIFFSHKYNEVHSLQN